MSENKFIAKLKGEPTPKSVVEIQNDRLVAPFKSSPMGHIADRDSSVVVAKGAQNWAVNQGQLVPVADDYIGTESDLTATSRVLGAGLWLNATYTFPATGDETNPVSAIIAPSAKWVLTLCGDSLITQNGSVITLTMLVKIGATHLTTKQFKVRECASQFSRRLAIDFSESEQSVIKAHGGSPLTVQVLCDDEGASATIYSGMTHLTLLQRKIDADLVATDNVLLPEFIENLLEGYIIPADYFSNYEYLQQVEDGGSAFPQFTRSGDDMNFSGWLDISSIKNDLDELGDQVSGIEEKIPGDASATNQLATKADLANIDLDGYVKKSGDTMTGDLSFDIVDDKYKNIVWNPESEVWVDDITVETRKYLVGPKIVSTGFDILQQYPTYQDASVVLGGVSVESDRFYPARSDGVMKLGLPNRRWDNVYTTNINNGNDLIVPTEGGTLARIEDLIDLRADINEADSELQTQITAQAAEIATKQDQLTAGDNIIISGNVISATGAGGGAGFDVVVVQELPAAGQKGIIYLLAKDGAAPDVYDEYVWIETTQTFELIGTTQVDLTGYVKNTDYANANTGGVIKIATSRGLTMSDGYLYALTKTLDNYTTSADNTFIGKGTLENIKEDLVARAIENTVTTQNLTVGSGEGTLYIGDVAGTATIATNNGLDIVAQTKFDTAPTTDDNTTYANALDTSLVRKAQVATAIADAMANVDALPDQTGNMGKVLTTDGANAGWTEMPGLIIRRL